jgi:hypothetical protein
MHVQGEDPDSIVRDYSYRVEAGSVRKPNVATKIENINNAMQVMMPTATSLLQAGRPEIFNALIADWGAAMSIDVTKYVVPPPPPPPPPQAPPETPPQQEPPQ